MTNSILHLNVGQSGVIIKLLDENVTCKLVSLGLVPDVKVELIRKAPFGGALFVKIGQQFLAIRESEAASVEIDIV